MGGYLGLGDLGSDIQDPNCSEARYSIHSLSLGLRDQIQVTFVVPEALRGYIRRFWGLRGHIVDQDLTPSGRTWRAREAKMGALEASPRASGRRLERRWGV